MPELPEVQTIVNGLRPKLAGLALAGLRIFNPALLRREKGFRGERVRNKKIRDVRRRGKMIVIECQDGFFLIFHLKMTGRLDWVDRREPRDKHTHLALSFRGQTHELRYRDVRKFGFLRCLESSDPMTCPEIRRLGPEPLSLGRSAFLSLFQGRRGRLKSLLLDQTFLAGIGNIYADEILFEAGLHPLKAAFSLTPRELGRLWTAMRSVSSARHRGRRVLDSRLQGCRRSRRPVPAGAPRLWPSISALPAMRHENPESENWRPDELVLPPLPNNERKASPFP